jgi:hypothetical protein
MNADSVSLAQDQGRALYHKIWLTLKTRFWDPKRIVWDAWEHRFDDAIDGIESAKSSAVQLIAALNDGYTKLVENEATPDPASNTKTGSALILDVVSSELLDHNIGYLRISSFSRENVLEQVQHGLVEITNCDGFIIDLAVSKGMTCISWQIHSSGSRLARMAPKIRCPLTASHASLIRSQSCFCSTMALPVPLSSLLPRFWKTAKKMGDALLSVPGPLARALSRTRSSLTNAR